MRLFFAVPLVLVTACASGPYEDTSGYPATTRNTAPEAATAETAPGRSVPGPGSGSVADATTTAVGLSQGFVEGNPVLSPCGPAAPVCSVVVKQGVKHALVESGVHPVQAHRSVEAGGWLGACANVATLAGAAPPVAVGIGAGCAAAYLAETASPFATPYERIPE